MKYLALALGALALALTALWIAPVRGATEAPTFTASTDPTVAVLYVALDTRSTVTTRSMTVYGNGRVELRKRRLTKTEESYDLDLEPQDVDRLLQLAVDHRLAEWDNEHIESRTARRLDEMKILVSDGATLHVRLALTSYERGDVQLDDVSKDIEVYAAGKLAEMSPDVVELQGLLALEREMTSMWTRASGEAAP